MKYMYAFHCVHEAGYYMVENQWGNMDVNLGRGYAEELEHDV
jgi:hypothetical protein